MERKRRRREEEEERSEERKEKLDGMKREERRRRKQGAGEKKQKNRDQLGRKGECLIQGCRMWRTEEFKNLVLNFPLHQHRGGKKFQERGSYLQIVSNQSINIGSASDWTHCVFLLVQSAGRLSKNEGKN